MLISPRKNNINFTSTPIHYVNLKKLTNGVEDGFVKAVFSKLNPSDKKDIDAIIQINQDWDEEYLVSEYCGDFIRNISPDINQYHAIELLENKDLGDKIVGLVKYYFKNYGNKENLHLSWLITNPKAKFISRDEKREIKGVGEILLGETFNKAKEHKALGLEFSYGNDSFYKKTFENAGINIINGKTFNPSDKEFYVETEDFDKYINYCQNKYSTDFSAKIKDGIIM